MSTASEAARCTDAACGVTAQQHIGVEIPISLQPFTQLGPIRAECCGTPSVLTCQVYQTTGGVSCTVRIAQTLRLDIPISFGAEARPGAPDVQACGAPELITSIGCAGC